VAQALEHPVAQALEHPVAQAFRPAYAGLKLRATALKSIVVFLGCVLAVASVGAQREHTRPPRDGAAVNDSQAADLTLTLSQAVKRPIQQVVRTASSIDKARKVLTATVLPPEASLIEVGQRVRSFPLESKSSMYQARVTRVARQGDRAIVEATLTNFGRENSATYVTEIIVERGEFLSVPNEAIIEEGDKRVVYTQMHPGHYVPQEIHAGLQGELYTQILHGLSEGTQVVTFGSFFIDSEYKLKTTTQAPMSHDHRHN
jgi:hypothetical protein